MAVGRTDIFESRFWPLGHTLLTLALHYKPRLHTSTNEIRIRM